MRALFTFLAVTLLAAAASAQFQFTIVAGDVITIDAVSPGGTCTYGGFSVEHDPLIGSTTSDHWCFPGNTGPQGPQGATGPAGSDAPKLVYVDQSSAVVTDLLRIDGEAAYWDGAAYWAIDATTGGLQTPTVCSFGMLVYDESGCTGDPFLAFEARNMVRCARNGAGTQSYWRQTSSYTHSGSCWSWNGSTCASTGCPGNPVALVTSAGSAPDLSGYSEPFTLIVDE